jgi:membrane protein DedA with SNARE-associated domain
VNSALTALLHFSNHDISWMAQFFTLLLLPFAHEDLAIILGAYLVVNKVMPVALVVLCIYGGMVVSDFALYFVGVGARRLPWLTRLAVDGRVRNVAATLQRNLFGVLALCRAVPGVAFIGIIACGWTRVPLARFGVACLAVSALYLPLMLYLAVVFGDALDDRVGWWAWPTLIVALAGIDLARRRVFAFGEMGRPAAGDAVQTAPVRKPALAERSPAVLFYLPLALTWLRFAWRHRSLTLPSAANPRLPSGGRRGEALSDYLNDVAAADRAAVAEFVVFARGAAPRSLYADIERVRQSLRDVGLSFPLMVKPDIDGHRHGATRVDDLQMLRDYLRHVPGGTRLLLQRFVPLRGEAVLVYARLPGAEKGRILSLTFHHTPYVIGDGRSSVRELVRKNKPAHVRKRLKFVETGRDLPFDPVLDRIPGAGEVAELALNGARCRDARHHITAALEARFDAIAKGMSEFHYGRFDLRFGSMEEFDRAENLAIVGICGAGADGVEAWDPQLPLLEVYRRFIDQQRIMFLIGEKNRARGFKPVGCGDFLKSIAQRIAFVRRRPVSA